MNDLFIICAEIVAIMIWSNQNIKGLFIINTSSLLGQYADDNQLILDGSEKYLFQALDTLHKFPLIAWCTVSIS